MKKKLLTKQEQEEIREIRLTEHENTFLSTKMTAPCWRTERSTKGVSIKHTPIITYFIPFVNEKRRFIMKNNEKWLTDDQVETEIARLKESEAVTLARYAEQLKYRRRHYLYKLRDLEKKGKVLMEAGITREILEATLEDEDYQ